MSQDEILREQIAEFLAEDDAEIFERGENVNVSLTGDAELWRVWPELAIDLIPQAIDFLNTYTSVKNYSRNKPLKYVEEPKTKGEVWDGRWRQAYVRRIVQGDVTKLVQVLRRGYADSLIDEEARLDQQEQNPIGRERMLRRVYHNLNFEKLNEMLDGIESTKYVVDPVIAGEKHEGTWRVLKNVPSRVDDGSGLMTQILGKGLIKSPDELPVVGAADGLAVLVNDDLLLLSPFVNDVTSDSNKVVIEYRWIDPDYAVELRDKIVLEGNKTLTDGGKIDAKVLKAEDGSCSIQVLAIRNTWQGTLAQKWREQTEYPSFKAQKIVTIYSHLPVAGLAGYKTDLLDTTKGYINDGYQAAGVEESKDAEAGFGSLTLTQVKTFEDASESHTVTNANGKDVSKQFLALLQGGGTDGVYYSTMWLGVPDSQLDGAMLTLSTPPTGYRVVKLYNNYNGTGLCNIVREMAPAGPYERTSRETMFPTFLDERRTYWYAGLTAAEATAQYATCLTTPDGGYKVDSVEVQEYRWDTVLVIQHQSKLNASEVSHQNVRDYTSLYGMVTSGKSIYLNVGHDAIEPLKTKIKALTDRVVLAITDNDAGQGRAHVEYTWRALCADPARYANAVRIAHLPDDTLQLQRKVWFDIPLAVGDTEADKNAALNAAVAKALAGSVDPYTKESGEDILLAEGRDNGDRTGIVERESLVRTGALTYAEYLESETIRPHSIKTARRVYAVREYLRLRKSELGFAAGTAYASLASWLADTSVPAGTGYTWVAQGRIQVSYNGRDDGTFLMRGVKYAAPTWDGGITGENIRNWGVEGGEYAGDGEHRIGFTITNVSTGIPVSQAENYLQSMIPISGAYALGSANVTERENGEAVIVSQHILKDMSPRTQEQIAALGLQRKQRRVIWPICPGGTDILSTGSGGFDTYIAAAKVGAEVEESRSFRILATGLLECSVVFVLPQAIEYGRNLITSPTLAAPNMVNNGYISATYDDGYEYTMVGRDLSEAQVDKRGKEDEISGMMQESGKTKQFIRELNRYGLWDYIKKVRVIGVPSEASDGVEWRTYGEYYWVPYWSGLTNSIVGVYKRRVSFVHNVKWCTTAAGAEAHIGASAYQGSNISRVGVGTWVAHRILRSDVQDSYTPLT